MRPNHAPGPTAGSVPPESVSLSAMAQPSRRCHAKATTKPNLQLLGRAGQLLISIDSRSWHVLDEPDLFPDGMQLRKTFGITWASGLFREPPHGILQRMPAAQFRLSCERVWQSLLRDRDLLAYSYQYEFGRQKGVRHGGGMGGGFHVRGLVGSIKATPKGYCTLRLRASSPDPSGRFPFVEVIDLRKERSIETDDAGYLKIHRRAMSVDWYREMPRILEFCEQNGTDTLEVRLYDT